MSLEEVLVHWEASVYLRKGRLPIVKGQLAPKIFFHFVKVLMSTFPYRYLREMEMEVVWFLKEITL